MLVPSGPCLIRGAQLLRSALSLVLVGLLLSAPCQVWAQDAETRLSAAARQFFSQGLAFADQGDWSRAADRFRRALAIRHSSVIAFNLATSLGELGEVVEATELLYAIEADPEADAELLASTRSLLQRLRPRMASLTVVPEPKVARQLQGTGRLAVWLDGVPLSEVELGAPIPVDPSAHEVTLRSGQRVLHRYPVASQAGQHQEVRVGFPEVPSPAETAALAHARAEARARAEGDRPITHRWWFWAGVGTVVAGAVAAITIATLSADGQRAGTTTSMAGLVAAP